MSNTINDKATSNSDAVKHIHGAALDFIAFLKAIQTDIGIKYPLVHTVPSRVSNLLAQKVKFDDLAIPDTTVKSILEKNHGYDDWTEIHTADFDAIFTKATAFMVIVENNITLIPPSYNASHVKQWVSAPQNVQDALNSQINGILVSIV